MRFTAGKNVVVAILAVIPAYLIGSDIFFRSQVVVGAKPREHVLTLASAGFMRERRSLSLVCSDSGEARLVLKAKLAEKGFLNVGEKAPATIAFEQAKDAVASVDAPGTVIANGFVETVATPALTAEQLSAVARGMASANAVQVTAIGRGVTLGIDASAAATEDALSRCGTGATPGKQSLGTDRENKFADFHRPAA